MLLKLKLPMSERLQFLAGQYIDILLKDGRRRSFSLANAPHDDALLELHIRHIQGGFFTDHVFNEMKEKAILRIEGPLGSFFVREDSDRPLILMAGGTGFAPIKGIVEHLIAQESNRPIHIYWGARDKADLYLNQLAQQWSAEHSNIEYTPVLSATKDTSWQGRTGFVHQAVADDHKDLSTHEIYACGPPAMIDAGRKAFNNNGLDEDFFFTDAFTYAAN
jgi:CDP-4-dehydro-6-deoxyglucose reductase